MTPQLTWDTQTSVAVSHAAAHSMGAGVQGTEVHQLGTSRTSEACCAATAKPKRSGSLRIACAIIVTGTGRTGVDLLLTCCTLVACERGSAETRDRSDRTVRKLPQNTAPRKIRKLKKNLTLKVPLSIN